MGATTNWCYDLFEITKIKDDTFARFYLETFPARYSKTLLKETTLKKCNLMN